VGNDKKRQKNLIGRRGRIIDLFYSLRRNRELLPHASLYPY